MGFLIVCSILGCVKEIAAQIAFIVIWMAATQGICITYRQIFHFISLCLVTHLKKKKKCLLENLLGSSTCFVAGRVTGVLLHLVVPNGVAIRRMMCTALWSGSVCPGKSY